MVAPPTVGGDHIWGFLDLGCMLSKIGSIVKENQALWNLNGKTGLHLVQLSQVRALKTVRTSDYGLIISFLSLTFMNHGKNLPLYCLDVHQ